MLMIDIRIRIRIRTSCQAGRPVPWRNEVGGSEGRGLESHALYINMDIDKPFLHKSVSIMIDKSTFMKFREI